MRDKKRVLILGATGMLGHTLVQHLGRRDAFEVHSSTRTRAGLEVCFSTEQLQRIHSAVNADDFSTVEGLLQEVRPNVVINCIGVIKQLSAAKDPLACIAINALFPHRLAKACASIEARLIHISTDCVFSGQRGNYVESDFPDCDDLYGRTKLLGEVDYPNAVTLRTSIIGHELASNVSLIDWFLAQEGRIKGFSRAIYTGFPTVEMARIISEVVIPRPELRGLYHVSSDPISKYELLCLVKDQYGKKIEIEPYADFFCDRSLNSRTFRTATGYTPPTWSELVAEMYEDWRQVKGQ